MATTLEDAIRLLVEENRKFKDENLIGFEKLRKSQRKTENFFNSNEFKPQEF